MNTLDTISITGKKILYRVDINASIYNGVIADDTRIRRIIPGIKRLLSEGADQVILLAHQGRSTDKTNETILTLHAERIQELLGEGTQVEKLNTSRPTNIQSTAPVVILENVRLDKETGNEEEKHAYAKDLAQLGDVFVNDAFAACHRNHASIAYLPLYTKEKAAGPLLQAELEALSPLLSGAIQHPLTVIIAGAKIDTKIGVIKQFMKSADTFLLGGGIANTFLAAEGYDVGASLYEPDKLDLAREIALEIEKERKELFLPEDVLCADEISETVPVVDLPVEDVIGQMKILDIGKKTAQKYSEKILSSATVVWNGPVGLTEIETFRKGSESLAHAMINSNAQTFVGGGESVGVINSLGISHDRFSHVSTGGGAMLDFLSGKKLPGVAVL